MDETVPIGSFEVEEPMTFTQLDRNPNLLSFKFPLQSSKILP